MHKTFKQRYVCYMQFQHREPAENVDKIRLIKVCTVLLFCQQLLDMPMMEIQSVF